MLEIEGLRVDIEGVPVLQDVEIAVRRGEVVAVMSRNAAGKSTLLEAIIGIMPVTAGRISFGKRDITRLGPFERAALGIGYVPQKNRFFSSLSVEEHLTVAARPGPHTAMQICRNFPALGARRKSPVSRLSADEQHLLALGCALSLNPRLLLVDDVFENLDPAIRHEVFSVLAGLKEEGIAMLLVGNSLKDLRYFANRFIVMDAAGRIGFETPQTHVLLRPEELERRLHI
jgi:branched-chain amino acid transport system ATP-binding protein